MRNAGEPEDLLGRRASIVLIATYAVGLLASPFLLDPIHPYLERHTETPAEASDAFIVICCIAAGIVPLILAPIILIGRALMRRRAVGQIARRTGVDAYDR